MRQVYVDTKKITDLKLTLVESLLIPKCLPSKHFLKICEQMFDKMSSVSSKNVTTNLLRYVACLNTFSSHCLHYMLLETSLRFLKKLQKDCQWLFVNISFADSLRFVFKNQKQNVYEPLAKFSLRYLFIDCLRFASIS